MSRRIEKLESTLARELSKILAEGLSDPRVRGLISITRLRLTDDRHTAIVDVSVLPGDQAKLTVQALRHARQHLRMELRSRVHVRPVPHLDFRVDESLKKQAEVLDAIRESLSDSSGTTPDDDTPDQAKETPS